MHFERTRVKKLKNVRDNKLKLSMLVVLLLSVFLKTKQTKITKTGRVYAYDFLIIPCPNMCVCVRARVHVCMCMRFGGLNQLQTIDYRLSSEFRLLASQVTLLNLFKSGFHLESGSHSITYCIGFL